MVKIKDDGTIITGRYSEGNEISSKRSKILIIVISVVILVGIIFTIIQCQTNNTEYEIYYDEAEDIASFSENNNYDAGENESSLLTIDEYMGYWEGYYNNNSGVMDLTINLYDYEQDNTRGYNEFLVTAEFIFSPRPGRNSGGKSGKYLMRGYINVESGYIWMVGKYWLSTQPSGYNMLDIEGEIDLSNGTFNGRLKRDKNTGFWLER